MSQNIKISKQGPNYWSREAILALIEVYKKCTCLYDKKSPDYHNRAKNRDALQEMVNVVSKYIPDVTRHKCKQKYQCLRSQFNREYLRILNSIRSGDRTEEVIQPKLWCFKLLLFLKDSLRSKPRTCIDIMMEEDDTNSSENEIIVENFVACKTEYPHSPETENASMASSSFFVECPKPDSSYQYPSELKRTESCPSSSPSSDMLKSSNTNSLEESSSPLQTTFLPNLSNYLEEKQTFTQKVTQIEKSKTVVFGEFVTSRLETMKPKYRKKLEKEICELIFKHEEMYSDSD